MPVALGDQRGDLLDRHQKDVVSFAHRNAAQQLGGHRGCVRHGGRAHAIRIAVAHLGALQAFAAMEIVPPETARWANAVAAVIWPAQTLIGLVVVTVGVLRLRRQLRRGGRA